MKKYLQLILTAILAAYGSVCAAQDIVVVGQVMSSEDGGPLASANVWFKRTNIGCTTNEEGFFMLRSSEPQHTLVISVVGYKTREYKLDYGKDQMIQVFLHEDISLLDEIIAIPSQDEAIAILRQVRKRRQENNPKNLHNIATDQTSTTLVNLTNIKGRLLQRKLFNQLRAGTISSADSTYTLPAYADRQSWHHEIRTDSASATPIYQRTEALQILPTEQWRQFVATYSPDIDFYKPYSTIMGANFMNPTAHTAHHYYNIYLADSSRRETKQYKIHFKPKIDAGSLLKGYLWVDSATYAITSVHAKIGTTGSVKFLNSIDYSMEAIRLHNVFFPSEEEKGIGLSLDLFPSAKSRYWGAILQSKDVYTNTTLLSDSISHHQPPPVPADSDGIDGIDKIWSSIDTINQSRIQKLASWAVDLILYQHLHIWKIDLGPLPNLIHYNRMEGLTTTIPLRSNALFSKTFTFGGYLGYGFGDRRYKFGANAQWRFGTDYRNTLSLFFDDRMFRYGYDDVEFYAENRIHDIEHIGNTLTQAKRLPTIAKRSQFRMRYSHEKGGFKFTANARALISYGNSYIPYIQNGHYIDHIEIASLNTDVRLSWKQHSLDGYFQRLYLASRYPVVHLNAEAGCYKAGEQLGFYGKFGIYAKQNVAVGFGRLQWMLQASAVAGNVPFPVLIMARSTRGSYTNTTDFRLLNQMELMSDLYACANIRYQTRGYIFGYIPYLKKLGIREDLIFNIGYGSIRKQHQQVLAIPALVSQWGGIPYIEAGFGFSNILQLGNIELIWRITHRENPFGSNFGVRWSIEL